MASRLFAIADLHGDLERSQSALSLVGLVNSSFGWSGGSATLVQTGDLVDRGPQSLEVMRFFDDLEQQASAHGGRVVRLIGNHEVMNMQGDLRYVHPAELRKAGGAQMWSALFEPQAGAVASRLVRYPTAVLAGRGACSTLFVHAGLQPQYLFGRGRARERVARLNQLFQDALMLARTSERKPSPNARSKLDMIGNAGPVWYRGFAYGDESSVCAQLRSTLDMLGAWRMVVGHTITPDHTHALLRCSGLLHMIDVGMSSAYYGSLAAWTCEARDDLGAGWASARVVYPPEVMPSKFATLQTVYANPNAEIAEEQTAAWGEEAELPSWSGASSSASLAARCRTNEECLGLSIEGEASGEEAGHKTHLLWRTARGSEKSHKAIKMQLGSGAQWHSWAFLGGVAMVVVALVRQFHHRNSGRGYSSKGSKQCCHEF
ncbi:MAG: hypothetical protein SGPRY_007677 [Prymnesium sp.]